MKKTAQFLKNNLFPIILVVITVFIAYQNYTPGTFLTGWDTLHPEFNFSLYWKRILSGVWQEHQGLGAVASQAHASEIPRIIILQFFSLFLKLSQIRYAYAFLMLVLGPLGVFYFLKYILPKKSFTNTASFIGALLYLLNLSTLQHFYVPLEMFLTHFAYLGWLLLFVVKYLDTGDRRPLIIFAILNLLSAPQAHTSTLFVAYFMCLTVFLLARIFIKPSFRLAKKSFIVLLISILINSFWLLPNIYFIIEKGEDVANSKIHSLFSDEAFLQNQEYGGIKDTAILRNFLFNWGEHVGNGEFGDLMNEWAAHQKRFLVLPIGYLIFLGYLIGGGFSTLRGRKYAFATLASSFVALFFIMNTNPPFGFIFRFFQAYVPLFEEAFRFPFTKFSTILAFGYSALFTFFIFELFSILEENLVAEKFKLTKILVTVIFPVLLVYYMFPAFTGHLISPSMRVRIPQRYFNMFEYFDEQSEYGRVADFPIHSFWGWGYYDWDEDTRLGYQGAGFLWFGIKQPLLNREFDRWDPENEQYYREMSYAVYSQNVGLFDSLLEKYQVKWLILDESVFSPDYGRGILFIDELKDIFERSEKVQLDRAFGDELFVYKVADNYKREEVINDYVIGDSYFNKENYDPVYSSFGSFISSENNNFPFVGITNQDESLDVSIVGSSKDSVYLKLDTAGEYERNTVVIEVYSRYENGKNYIDIYDVSNPDNKVSISVNLSTAQYISLNSQIFDLDPNIKNEEIGRVYLGTSNSLVVELFNKQQPTVLTNLNSLSTLETCSTLEEDSAYSWELKKGGFELFARNVNACVTIPLKNILNESQVSSGAVLNVETSYLSDDIAGDLCLFDSKNNVCIGNYSVLQNSIEVLSYIDQNNLENLFLRFTTKGRNSTETSINYSNIRVSLLEPYFSKSYKFINVDDSVTSFSDLLSFEKLLDYDPADLKTYSEPSYCSSGTTVKDEVTYTKTGIRYESDDKFICDSIQLKSLDTSLSYIVEVTSRNVDGLPMRMCVLNTATGRCDKYVSLPKSKEFVTSYYLVPPGADGSKYALSLVSMHFGGDKFVNEISSISFTPIPFDFLKNLYDNVEEGKSWIFVLNESYDEGWVAFCGLKPCFTEQVRVNNWANGWVFENPERVDKVRVVFWPQYLEFIGLLLLVPTAILIVKKRKGDKI